MERCRDVDGALGRCGLFAGHEGDHFGEKIFSSALWCSECGDTPAERFITRCAQCAMREGKNGEREEHRN